MFLTRKKKLKVDLSELEEERESLYTFLHSTFNVNMISNGNKMVVDSEKLSSQDLKKVVNKFVYRRNLNSKYWVALEDNVVKIHKLKNVEKHKKRKKKIPPPSTIKHGW